MNNKQHLIKLVFIKNPQKLFSTKEIAESFGISYFRAYYIIKKIKGVRKFRRKNKVFFSKVNYNLL